jgi:peroxiredoxin Q/BCP
MKKIVLPVVIFSIIIGAAHGFALEAGDKAPLFKAESTQGTISLADYLGNKNVVLAFYFADFTPV